MASPVQLRVNYPPRVCFQQPGFSWLPMFLLFVGLILPQSLFACMKDGRLTTLHRNAHFGSWQFQHAVPSSGSNLLALAARAAIMQS
jgi:hypothetical protein